MSKKLLSVAIAAAMAAPLAAQAEIKLSGTIQAEIGSIELNGGSIPDEQVNDTNDSSGALYGGGPNKLRFDFSEDLGGGLKAFGMVDQSFNTTNDDKIFGARERFVGLKGSSGPYFRIGRIQGAYKTTPKIDTFYGTTGQMRIGGGESSGKWGHGGFVDNVAELGFSGGGFKVALQGIFEEKDGEDGSMLANASYSNDMFTVYGGYSKNEALEEYNTNYKVGGKVSFGGLGLGLQYEDVEMNSATLFSLRPDSGMGQYVAGSATYGLGSVILSGWVAQFSPEDDVLGEDALSFAVGAIYAFSKKTIAYAAYHSVDSDYEDDTGDISGFAAGVRHSF
jgi:predicted porin